MVCGLAASRSRLLSVSKRADLSISGERLARQIDSACLEVSVGALKETRGRCQGAGRGVSHWYKGHWHLADSGRSVQGGKWNPVNYK